LLKYDSRPGAFHMIVTKRAIHTAMENQAAFILESNVFASIYTKPFAFTGKVESQPMS
jgi:hypothetical protein